MRDCGGLVYDSRIPAPGGLPWGFTGEGALPALTQGISISPVASWLAMKRGCEVSHLHMDGGRWAGGNVKTTAMENHHRLSLWCPGADLPDGSLPMPNLSMTGCRRNCTSGPAALRSLQTFHIVPGHPGTFVRARGWHRAILTGENIGQVASQTLANLAVISDATTIQCYRPLITYDKEETVALARRIGTFMEKRVTLPTGRCPACRRLSDARGSPGE